MPYFIPYRLRTNKSIIHADGPFNTHETAVSLYQNMTGNFRMEVHSPVMAESREEAIEKSKSPIGFFQDAESGGE